MQSQFDQLCDRASVIDNRLRQADCSAEEALELYVARYRLLQENSLLLSSTFGSTSTPRQNWIAPLHMDNTQQRPSSSGLATHLDNRMQYSSTPAWQQQAMSTPFSVQPQTAGVGLPPAPGPNPEPVLSWGGMGVSRRDSVTGPTNPPRPPRRITRIYRALNPPCPVFATRDEAERADNVALYLGEHFPRLYERLAGCKSHLGQVHVCRSCGQHWIRLSNMESRGGGWMYEERLGNGSHDEDSCIQAHIGPVLAPRHPDPPRSGNNATRRRRTNEDIAVADAPDIVISPRDNPIAVEYFWIVDLHADPPLTRGATPLIRRCMKAYGWRESYARKVATAYRQFLRLKQHCQDWDATMLAPSVEVEKTWRQHILDVNNYVHDCMLLCGHVIGYNPEGDDNIETRREATRRALLQLFPHQSVDQSPSGVWKEIFARPRLYR